LNNIAISMICFTLNDIYQLFLDRLESLLISDWSTLLESGDLSDLTIFSKEEFPFPVHTIVMHARCKNILVSLGKSSSEREQLLSKYS
jgi:hypothetical protein